jgi:ribosomal protein L44E
MTLPMSNTPIYTLTIPSNGKSVKYRPFLVKEEKALLIAQQSEDLDVMVDTLKQIIISCTDGKVDPEELAVFDIEYMFTQMRSKSVGEEVQLVFRCGHCQDENAKSEVTIDISKLEVIKDPTHTNKIELSDNIGVIMKYPSIDTLKILDDESLTDIEQVFRVICRSIDIIYNSEDTFYAKDETIEDIEAFVNNLTRIQFEKLKSFFDTMPKLKQVVEFDCPVCGAHNKTTLEGIQDFF